MRKTQDRFRESWKSSIIWINSTNFRKTQNFVIGPHVTKKPSKIDNLGVYWLQPIVCPKLFRIPKMYQIGPQMSNYCAQLPPHPLLYIHGRPQIQKFPYGHTHGPKFIVFQNARIQTIFEGVKKTYFKFNQITMRPAYNGEKLFLSKINNFWKICYF